MSGISIARFFLVLIFVLVMASASHPRVVIAADDVQAQLEAATAALSTEEYELVYKFQPGEIVEYLVEHLATVDTRISGNSQETKSRSASQKVWKITDVTATQFSLEHSVGHVDMWQKSGGRQEIRYNSETDTKVPAEYQHVVDSLHETLAVVTFDRSGNVIKRESKNSQPDLGFGSLVVPLPTGKIRLEKTWDVPHTVQLRERDGRIKEVKTQMRYRLEKVQTGVATISVRTQVLTPIDNPELKAQLVQKISNGEIKFDMDAGRVISKQLDWDESVVGFNGAGSSMKYLARFTETLKEATTAQRTTETKQ